MELILTFHQHILPVTLILATGLIKVGDGDLRFCLNGPHVMKDEDCPGGFAFNEATQPSCKYYAKTGSKKGTVLTVPIDVCDDNSARVMDDQDDLADVEKLTWFEWEEYATNDTVGTFPAENTCFDECLPDWIDEHYAPDEDPIPEDFDPASISAEDKEKLVLLNQQMFLRILMDDDYEKGIKKQDLPNIPGVPPLPPLPEDPTESNIQKGENSLISNTPRDASRRNVIKILAKSFKVAIAACAPFIRDDFMEQVLRGMMILVQSVESEISYVGHDLYKGIALMLDHCSLKHQQDFVLNGSTCPGNERIEGIFYPHKKFFWRYRLTGRSFRWGKYHPVLDATWTVIDLIQSFCFESFMRDMMYGHVYQMVMEELFPKKLQLLWRLNPPVKNDQIWNNLLQSDNLNQTMRNLDACAVAARNSSPFHLPLPRPFLTQADLEKPAPPPPQIAEYPKGWNKTIAQYWVYYEKQGGFKRISNKFGSCFQEHQDELDDKVNALKKNCPPT